MIYRSHVTRQPCTLELNTTIDYFTTTICMYGPSTTGLISFPSSCNCVTPTTSPSQQTAICYKSEPRPRSLSSPPLAALQPVQPANFAPQDVCARFDIVDSQAGDEPGQIEEITPPWGSPPVEAHILVGNEVNNTSQHQIDTIIRPWRTTFQNPIGSNAAKSDEKAEDEQIRAKAYLAGGEVQGAPVQLIGNISKALPAGCRGQCIRSVEECGA